MPKQSYKHCCNLQIFEELEREMHKSDLKTLEACWGRLNFVVVFCLVHASQWGTHLIASTFRPKWMLCFFVSMVWTLNLKAKGFETLRLGSHNIFYLFGWQVMLWRRKCLGDASLSPSSQPNHRLNEKSMGKMKRWSKGIIPWGTLRLVLLYSWFSIELSEPFVAGRVRWLIMFPQTAPN